VIKEAKSLHFEIVNDDLLCDCSIPDDPGPFDGLEGLQELGHGARVSR
jgi:hypothetical protein